MFTMAPNLKTTLYNHFKSQKLEFSYAISKPFPFFEGLRDKTFITERMYAESLEAYRNMVPISKVVYNILSTLEDQLSLSLLSVLFSQINLREYPNLVKIFKSFRKVADICGGLDRAVPIPFGALPGAAERRPRHILSLLPAPQQPPLRRLTPVPSVSELRAVPQRHAQALSEPSGLAGPARSPSRVTQKGRVTPVNLPSHITDEEGSQQIPSTSPAAEQVSCDELTPRTKGKEDAQETRRAPSVHASVIRDDSPEPNDPEEPGEAPSTPAAKKGKKRKRSSWLTPKKRKPKRSLRRGITSPGRGIQEKLQEVGRVTRREDDSTRNSELVSGAQKTERAQTSESEEVSDDDSEMSEAEGPQDPASTPPRIAHDPQDNRSKLSSRMSPGEKQKRKICSRSRSKPRQEKRLLEGTASPGHRIQEKLQVVDQATQKEDDSTRNSKIMTRAQKAKLACAGTSGPAAKERKNDVCSNSTRTLQKNIPQKGIGENPNPGKAKRVPVSERSDEDTVDFQSPTLPVTCGVERGILYREKMKKGSSEKCIQNEEGLWLTPKEFEVKGRGVESRNWKRNVRCGGKSLQQLLEKGFLLCPPRVNLKREREASDECEVCCRGGQLLRCDSCLRAFHEDCHIPPAEAERSPWSCTFCRMKESAGSQQCHREAEVLARPMGPAEQLKCEFILLKAYCHPQSAFFAKIPHNLQDYAEPFKEAMWLDLVKERLAEKVYTMAWFVRDMRLIFHNHRTFHQASDLSQIGLDLEAEFEKHLKEVFIFS